MDENLVGYLLNTLDETTHEQVASVLRSDARARERLDRLRQLLAPLEEDRELQPPPDLTIRTLAHVAEHCCKELPRSPQPAPRQAPIPAPLWRRADVLVAAAVLFAVVTLSVPLINSWRHQQAVLACKNNLREFYTAYVQYRDVHKKLPTELANRESSRNVAGMIAPILHEAKMLPDSASICCPATGGLVPCTVTRSQVGSLTEEEFRQQAPRLLPCYAFSLGYCDKGGYHCGLEPPPEAASSSVPLMADRPPADGMGNSTNHGGRGQNVLYFDGHVEFAISRNVGIDLDDIYLNRDRKVAAGIDGNDAVLGSSAAHP